MALRDFVRGMLLHDLAKPFFLGGDRHAIMGFLFLQKVGLHGESLAALWHHNLKVNIDGTPGNLEKAWGFLEKWSDHGPPRLPRWILYTSAIDQLASSAYSLSEEGPEVNAGSRQNPFTRLPVSHEDIPSSWWNECSDLHEQLWKEAGLEAAWKYEDGGNGIRVRDVLTMFKAGDAGKVRSDVLGKLPQQALERYIGNSTAASPHSAYTAFMERTYPPANDTPLLEHGRLCAALALALGVNMKRKGEDLCEPLESVDEARRGIQGDWIELVKHHDAQLLRICLHRWKDLAERAVRLDDLHGIRMALGDPLEGGTETWYGAFIRAFSSQVSDLMDDPSLREDILPLNRFAYDLVYLLPGSLSERELDEAVLQAAGEADRRLAQVLRRKYSRDFGHLAIITIEGESATTPDMDIAFLQKELAFLRPWTTRMAVRVEDVRDFGALRRAFGASLAKAYREIITSTTATADQLLGHMEELRIDIHGTGECCAVCGVNAVFEPFHELYEKADETGRDHLEKVMFNHKEETEKLCRFCLCVRTVSHGALKSPWLEAMIDHDGQNGHAVRSGGLGPVAPPPALMDRIPVREGERIPRDMGACFVRMDGNLQIFPTVHAACDEGSNLALVRLEANLSCLTGDYEYSEVIESLTADDKSTQGLGDLSDAKVFQAVFSQALFELTAPKNQGVPPDTIHPVRLHLARALVRMRWVDEAFRSLEEALVKGSGIRTLALESAFPICHLLVPAADLPRCLEGLTAHLTCRLFSSVAFQRTRKDRDGCLTLDQESLEFLEKALPRAPVLLGAAVVFKARQALYQALRAARHVTEALQSGEARGLALRIIDLRSGLGFVDTPGDGQPSALSLVDLFHLDKALRETDRRDLLRLADLEAAAAQGEIPILARARIHLLQAKALWRSDLRNSLDRPGILPEAARVKTAAKSRTTDQSRREGQRVG
ncbi:MAG: hypothetical protein MUF52_16965 [Syntrophobacteraceae bacterium]|jgi:hypothetical protein|nr:hypothetical protein [Syntrophobacteraceae bacterium]